MKLFISGYGKMGRMIEKIILDRGLDYAGWTEAVTGTDPALAKECVCIDFTTPAAIRENYRFLAENFKAVVIGTTGWADIKDEVIAYFEKCGTPMIWASNFSIGVNVFFAVTDYISKTLGETGGYSPSWWRCIIAISWMPRAEPRGRLLTSSMPTWIAGPTSSLYAAARFLVSIPSVSRA